MSSFGFTPQTQRPLPLPLGPPQSTATLAAKSRDSSGPTRPEPSQKQTWKLMLCTLVLSLLGVLMSMFLILQTSAVSRDTLDKPFSPSGYPILSVPSVACFDETLPANTTCQTPFILVDYTLDDQLRAWINRYDLDAFLATKKHPNPMPGYGEISPRLKVLSGYTASVIKARPSGSWIFRRLQEHTREAIDSAFLRAQPTFSAHPNPSVLTREVRALFGDSGSAEQRKVRAMILTDFTRKIMKRMEEFQDDPWWMDFGSEVHVLRHAIENVDQVSRAHWAETDYYSRQTCQDLIGKDKCNAYDINEQLFNRHDESDSFVLLAEDMQSAVQSWHSHGRQAYKDMKHEAGNIEAALLNATSATMLDTPEAFTRFVWSFARLTRPNTSELMRKET